MRELEPGDTFGDLTIERKLGQGAFGSVYLARDALINRPVALKLLTAQSGRHEQVLKEARLVGQLTHDNVVTLYRVHPPDGSGAWGFEFEYVDGGTLQDVVEAGGAPSEEAFDLAVGITSGLAAAHRAGVVHGDVKPGNILIGDGGVPKIADFGLGRLLGDISLHSSEREGAAGTPAYMAPEILMGEAPTPASDCWSLGVVLYALVRGRLPFQAWHMHNLIYAVQNLEPPVPPANTPDELTRAIRACMAKKAEDRCPNAGHVAGILHAVGPKSAVQDTPVPVRPVSLLRGRNDEIRRVRDVFETAVQGGTGSCVLITGDDGIGKSALAGEAAAWARSLGFVWVQARVSGLEGVVRPLLRGVHSAMLHQEALVKSAPAAITQVLESSKQLRMDASQHALATLQTSFAQILRNARLAIVIEDLGEGNADDIGIATDLARRLVADGVVVVLVARAGLSGSATHELGSKSFIETVVLGPLSPVDSYALLEDVAGMAVAPEVSRRIHDKAKGNPRFTLDLFRHMRESDTVTDRHGRIEPGRHWDVSELPHRFRDLVAARLDHLEPGERELLDIASVAGEGFDGEEVAALMKRPILSVLRQLQAIYRNRGLVVPLAQGYRFSSPIVQDVIYNELAPDLRRVLHRAFAEHLAERPDVDPERLGVHWERAGEPDKAAPHLRDAAKAAMRRLEMLRTIDLAARGGVSADTIDPIIAEDNQELLLCIHGFHFDLGQIEAAEKVAEALMQVQSSGQLRFRAVVRQMKSRYSAEGEKGVDLEALERAALELEPCAELVMARMLMGTIFKFRGDLDAAETQQEQAMAALAKYPNDGLRASVLDQLASIALRRGGYGEAERLFRDSAEVSRQCGRLRNAATSDVNRVIASFQRGALEGLEADLKNAIRTLELEQSTKLPAHARVVLAMVQYAEGNLEGAKAGLEATVGLLEDLAYWLGLGDALVLQGGFLAVEGRYDEALDVLRNAEKLGERHGFLQARCSAMGWRTKCLVATGRHEEAEEVARACQDLLRATDDAMVQGQAIDLLAEAVFMGLRVVPAVPEGLEPGERAAAMVRAAAQWLAGEGTEALRAAVPILRDPSPAERRAELAILANFLEAEAFRREGDTLSAKRVASGALNRARSLGHAWYQQALAERL